MANRWLELERTLASKRGSTPRTLSSRPNRTRAYASSSTIPAGTYARAKRSEGNIEHMYVDTTGNVTVGVGHRLPDASATVGLAFLRNVDDTPATEQETKAEFAVVHGKPKGNPASFYTQFTKLHLAQSTIDGLLTKDLEQAVSGLKRDFPDYDSYPTGVREALIDMAFNLGNAGLVNGFPKFTGHIRNRAWKAAAAQSRRRELSKERNDEIEQLLNDAPPSG